MTDKKEQEVTEQEVETEQEVKLTLFQKLIKIRSELNATKDGWNTFGKYKYYQIEDIYKKAKKKFVEYEIFTVFQMPFNPAKLMYECTLTIHDASNNGDKLVMEIDCPLSKMKGASEAQQVGGVQTYTTKYLYLSLFMLDNSEDDDKKNVHDKTPAKKDNGVDTPAKLREAVMDMINNHEIESILVKQTLKTFKVSTLDSLDKSDYQSFLKILNGGQ